ncbi:NADAR family protein [Streptomyces spiramenti]|uniref:NADAR family protein n=1 Tax=Streptomyces spiramenti TaxID=2720606 RepID=A0ABX1ASB6_9ACTN|nr:NADAR family protein [Streptomyces spiramenti]NJP68323.1 NADAR family protein [Streptomyces spiramenti]
MPHTAADGPSAFAPPPGDLSEGEPPDALPGPGPGRRHAELLRGEREGHRQKFLFFWAHTPPPGGGVGPGCLSQWWPAPFVLGGVAYPTAEHRMMAAKARLFGNDAVAERILAARHPGEAKALGRQVTGFDEARWSAHRYAVVVEASLAKFRQNRELGDYLRATGRRVLAEASPLDRVWGIGLTADAPGAARPSVWPGRNLLGFALMDARAALDD